MAPISRFGWSKTPIRNPPVTSLMTAKRAGISSSSRSAARIAGASELAETVRFLASDGSGFMTGQVLNVDGGRCLVDVVGDQAGAGRARRDRLGPVGPGLGDLQRRQLDVTQRHLSSPERREQVDAGVDATDGHDRRPLARRLEARYAYWGSRIGAAYGEPFRVDRMVPIDDPLEAFRKRGWAVL